VSALEVLVVAAAGGAGACLRLIVDGLAQSALSRRHARAGGRAVAFPLGTVVVNVSGSLAIGVVSALTAGSILPSGVGVVLGTGLLGGYTTFSTASLDAVQLARGGRRGAAVLAAVGTVVASVGAAALGFMGVLALV
jgi:CrcB protein